MLGIFDCSFPASDILAPPLAHVFIWSIDKGFLAYGQTVHYAACSSLKSNILGKVGTLILSWLGILHSSDINLEVISTSFSQGCQWTKNSSHVQSREQDYALWLKDPSLAAV